MHNQPVAPKVSDIGGNHPLSPREGVFTLSCEALDSKFQTTSPSNSMRQLLKALARAAHEFGSSRAVRDGMEVGIIVMLGNLPMQQPWFESLVQANGFEYKSVSSLSALRDLEEDDIVAVFFHANSLELPWKDCLVWIQSIVPGVRCVICHGFHEEFDWDVLSNWGVFHSLNLPLDPTEVRQSLGFIAADRNQAKPMISEVPKSNFEFA